MPRIRCHVSIDATPSTTRNRGSAIPLCDEARKLDKTHAELDRRKTKYPERLSLLRQAQPAPKPGVYSSRPSSSSVLKFAHPIRTAHSDAEYEEANREKNADAR